MDWELALDTLDDLIGRAEELRPSNFRSSVLKQANDMRDWIEEREHVTDNQIRAINNWSDAIDNSNR